MEIMFIVLVTLAVGHTVARWQYLPTKPIVVEEFKIEPVEVAGFKKLNLQFEDARGRVRRFELHPAYAHHLADELAKHSIRGLAKGQAE